MEKNFYEYITKKLEKINLSITEKLEKMEELGEDNTVEYELLSYLNDGLFNLLED